MQSSSSIDYDAEGRIVGIEVLYVSLCQGVLHP
ncbi:MAG: DUF2283 domain-containing protein [Gammaproteobacteria bacterium]|nr:DUF2283 domain-containing protein [Gammaproteobacteria bacterium]